VEAAAAAELAKARAPAEDADMMASLRSDVKVGKQNWQRTEKGAKAKAVEEKDAEPKWITTAKTGTWFSIMALVLLEIVVHSPLGPKIAALL